VIEMKVKAIKDFEYTPEYSFAVIPHKKGEEFYCKDSDGKKLIEKGKVKEMFEKTKVEK